MKPCCLAAILVALAFSPAWTVAEEPVRISGIAPALAATNGGRSEVGVGAVVPWADCLWWLTYPAHAPRGSDDKLYQLDRQGHLRVRAESVGGTHASRMIHRESNQLILGPYFIDAQGAVRVVSPKLMPGRLTAVARHRTDPANKVYFFTMEDGLYEVDVHTLAVKTLHADLNPRTAGAIILPGTHGKGAYFGQGRLVVANNGQGGVLAEWDGAKDPAEPGAWTVVDRNKYTDVTGPGGIEGSPRDDAPIWAIGWDAKSLLLNVRDAGRWTRFRLPRASYTHDADHGWFTEWPRIRQAGGRLLMTMHGMVHEFPRTFDAAHTAGIRPIATHLRMITDFADFRGGLVCGCDDNSKFGNPLSGRPQSNLWFTSLEGLRELGPPAAYGGVWLQEPVRAGQPSEPFWLGGEAFAYRMVHVSHREAAPVSFALEVDLHGDGHWTPCTTLRVAPGTDGFQPLPAEKRGEWIRVKADRDVRSATAYFHYGSPATSPMPRPERFGSLAPAVPAARRSEGLLRPLDSPQLDLEFAASVVDDSGKVMASGYYILGGDLKLRKADRPEAEQKLRREAATSQEFLVDDASILVREGQRRFRLPKGPAALCQASASGWRRMIREVVTERNLMNVGGTFYELPRPESGGMAKIRPICTHHRRIFDFASWRGLLVLSGNLADASADEHFLRSDDGQVGLWLGNIDDLWKLGPPRGEGGPWNRTAVRAGVASDAYLMTGFDRKTLRLSHDRGSEVGFTIQTDFTGTGDWHVYRRLSVPAGQTVVHIFPPGYAAHWVRLQADQDCQATAWLVYGGR